LRRDRRGFAGPGLPRPVLPLAALAAGLHSARGRLDALETGDAVSSVLEVLSWSCRQLSPPASSSPVTGRPRPALAAAPQ